MKEIIFKRVVLPHPEGPRRVKNSPFLTFNETCDRAVKLSYFIMMSFTSSEYIRNKLWQFQLLIYKY